MPDGKTTLTQLSMFDTREEWEDHWRGMPAFAQRDLAPVASHNVTFADGGLLYIHHESLEDAREYERVTSAPLKNRPGGDHAPINRAWFSGVVGQDLSRGLAAEERKRTQSIWWPEAEIGRISNKRWVSAVEDERRLPKYPLYVISKGRWESRLTARSLEEMDVPYSIVVEPQERDAYAAVIDPKKILVLPFSNLGLGSIPARNWVWEHSIGAGAARHWVIDDNINGFYRLTDNLKVQARTGATFRACEEFSDRYENVAMSGMNYFMFASRKTVMPPYYLNTRVYSCILLRNDLYPEFAWRGRYNEDTDLSIRLLKARHSTVLFNAFLCLKSTTMTMKGGNTEALYQKAATKEEDGRWRMAESLRLQHPELVRITEKWGRYQHLVDYTPFRHNRLRLRSGVEIADGCDEMGMSLLVTEESQAIPRARVEVISQYVATSRPEGWEPDSLPDLSRVTGPVGFDFETTGLRWWRDDRPCGFGVSWSEEGRTCSRYVAFGHRDGNSTTEANAVRWLQSDEGLKGKFVVAQNAPFDAHHFRKLTQVALSDVAARLGDVMHRAALLDDSRKRFGLDLVARAYLGRGKVEGLDMSRGAAGYAGWEIAPYGRRDVELLVDLEGVMAPLIEKQDLSRVLQLEDDVLPATIEMEENAALLDVAKLREWDQATRRTVEESQAKLRALVGRAVEPDKRDQVVELLEQLGVRVWDDRSQDLPMPSFADPATGRLSLSDDVLARVRLPETEALRDLAHALDVRSKFVVPYVSSAGSDGVLRFSLNQLRNESRGTVSGRYSCSKITPDEGANIQQCPDEVKHLFVPSEGNILFSSDAEQIEYRVFAEVAARLGWPRMAEMYERDQAIDFHDDVTGPIVRKYRPGFSRREVKTCNFMNLFGGGVDKHASQLGVSMADAKTIVEAYRAALPEARGALDWMSEQAKKNGFVRTFLGRRARFEPCPNHGWDGTPYDRATRKRSYCGGCPRLHKALNSVVQGSAADDNKEKLVDLYRARRRLGLTMRMTIHDQAVGDVPDLEAAREAHRVLNDLQPSRSGHPRRVRILWDSRVGPNWKDLSPKGSLS